MDDLGRIWLTGRIKEEINRAGFKVQPAELDFLLEQHPDVAEACVFAVPDLITGEAIGVAVRPAMAATINLSSLRSWSRERLRRDAVPEHWFVVQEIPRNARGKVDRTALRRALVGEADTLTRRGEVIADDTPWPVAGRAHIPGISNKPTGEVDIRRAVERAWTSVLDRRSFQADMRWSDAGGDSIGALSLLHYLERHLGRSMPLDSSSHRHDAKRSGPQHSTNMRPDRQAIRSRAADPGLPLVF